MLSRLSLRSKVGNSSVKSVALFLLLSATLYAGSITAVGDVMLGSRS